MENRSSNKQTYSTTKHSSCLFLRPGGTRPPYIYIYTHIFVCWSGPGHFAGPSKTRKKMQQTRGINSTPRVRFQTFKYLQTSFNHFEEGHHPIVWASLRVQVDTLKFKSSTSSICLRLVYQFLICLMILGHPQIQKYSPSTGFASSWRTPQTDGFLLTSPQINPNRVRIKTRHTQSPHSTQMRLRLSCQPRDGWGARGEGPERSPAHEVFFRETRAPAPPSRFGGCPFRFALQPGYPK